jgi:hypothetical protein
MAEAPAVDNSPRAPRQPTKSAANGGKSIVINGTCEPMASLSGCDFSYFCLYGIYTPEI